MTATAPNPRAILARVPARRFRLPAGPEVVTQARDHVRAAVRDWGLPVSEGVALLLTWHLVTSVTSEGPGGADGTEGPAGPRARPAERGSGGRAEAAGGGAGVVALGISCSRGALRVDVYDERRSLPSHGYEIVASMADDWGIYRTPAGRGVYFTLAFPGASPGGSPVGAAADGAGGSGGARDSAGQGGAGRDDAAQGAAAPGAPRRSLADTSAD